MQGVWLITYLEHVFLINKAEPTKCSLQVVQSLSHVTISTKYDSFKPLWHIWNLLSCHHNQETAKDLLI
uniref:Pco108913 n=1 Tax=Arundo donax TaxID=35708 RepID=A0A0A9FS54_ARUDO